MLRWLALLGLAASTGALASSPQFVQNVDYDWWDGGSSGSTTLAGPIQAGDLVVVGVTWAPQTSTLVGVTDSQGDSYQLATPLLIGDPANFPWAAGLYYAVVDGGTSALTLSYAMQGVTNLNAHQVQYLGVAGVSPVDGASAASGNGTTRDLDSGTLWTTSPGDLLVGWAVSPQSVEDAGVGFTVRDTFNVDMMEDTLTGLPGPYGATAFSNGTYWFMFGAAFRSASAVVDGGEPAGDAGATALPNLHANVGGCSCASAASGWSLAGALGMLVLGRAGSRKVRGRRVQHGGGVGSPDTR